MPAPLAGAGSAFSLGGCRLLGRPEAGRWRADGAGPCSRRVTSIWAECGLLAAGHGEYSPGVRPARRETAWAGLSRPIFGRPQRWPHVPVCHGAAAAAGRWLPGPMNLPCSSGYLRVGGQPTPVTERNRLACPAVAGRLCRSAYSARKLQPVRHKYVNIGDYKMLTSEAAMTVSRGLPRLPGSAIWWPRRSISESATMQL